MQSIWSIKCNDGQAGRVIVCNQTLLSLLADDNTGNILPVQTDRNVGFILISYLNQ